MKRSELIFNVISVPVDFFAVLAASVIAYFLRYRVETLPVLFELSLLGYLRIVMVGIPFLLLLFALSGLYTQKSTRSFWHETGKVITAVSAGLMIVVLLFFFNRNLFPSRLIILMAWFLIIFLVSFERAVLLYLQRKFMEQGIGLHRLLVVEGAGNSELISDLEKNPKLGYQIAAKVKYSDDLPQKIEAWRREGKLDELLQADQALRTDEVLKLVEVCEELGIKFNYLPSILESHKANIETDVIGSVPVIRLRSTPLDGWGKVVKRTVDVMVSALGLAVFSPLFGAIAIWIKLDSRGSVFFHQRRGSSYHNFEFYKFRTMHHEMGEGTPDGDRIRAELERQNARVGPYVKIKNDPRVTMAGRFLRKTKLDELPQLWHVLRGEMSLVGPRIHMTREVERFENRFKKIFVIKPGATGLAQINQFYNPELPFEEEIKLDLFYIENWSLRLDLYIIIKTFVLLLTKRPREHY